VTAVSNASPLISLARIDYFDLLPKLFDRVLIPAEVYDEAAIDGAGRPGAEEVCRAD
jgi:predicted nucleic acid-binding protein